MAQQTTLKLPKARRNTKQEQLQNKSIDENVVQIGKVNDIKTNKLEIHQEHLSETDKLLRAFDLNYAFGPCVGIKRIDRWERARALGLNPPQIIKDILVKDETQKQQESLFHQFRMI